MTARTNPDGSPFPPFEEGKKYEVTLRTDGAAADDGRCAYVGGRYVDQDDEDTVSVKRIDPPVVLPTTPGAVVKNSYGVYELDSDRSTWFAPGDGCPYSAQDIDHTGLRVLYPTDAGAEQ